jgi:hypothetical protein
MAIDRRQLCPAAIGKRVAYIALPNGVPPAYGVIHSYNEWYVFVLYDGMFSARATSAVDLVWVDPPPFEIDTGARTIPELEPAVPFIDF